jgi:hypothetical protein
MPKYSFLTLLIIIILLIPQITFASWWNPFSWNIFKKKSSANTTINVSTTTEQTNVLVSASSTIKNKGVRVVQQVTRQEETVTNQQSGLFSDLGISFSYPKELVATKSSFGWDKGADSGFRVNFDSSESVRRNHAFTLRYPCDSYNCNIEVSNQHTIKDVTLNGYKFKKLVATSSSNPYYPNKGYIEYLYIDPVKNVVIYEFHFSFGVSDSFFANYDVAKAASEKIMSSVKMDNYDHSKAYSVLLNQSPTISSFTGVTTLKVNQVGAWKIEVTDPENDKLYYVVRWGDEPSPMDMAHPFNWPLVGAATKYSSTTFTYTYKQPGTYTATVYVMDNDSNHIVSKEIAIKVGN